MIPPISSKHLAILSEYISKVVNDPLLFVKTAFPWNTDELKYDGPLKWQESILTDIRDGLLEKALVRIAVASGHGIGKSAIVSWIILWAMLRPYTRGVVTANTERQLLTKTWAELSKWYNLCICKDIFTVTKTSILAKGHEPTWRIDAIPWSDTRTEGFAGLHNSGGRQIILMDEGSAISDNVYHVAEGALTDKDSERIFCVFGNPTRPTGRFREFFGKMRAAVKAYTIDSRTVPLTDKEQLDAWEKEYGEDSDFFRVRVRGLFPKTAAENLIGEAAVNAAASRMLDVRAYNESPKVLGVDVARFGDDDSVIMRRQGVKAWEPICFNGLSTMELVGKIIDIMDKFKPDAVFVDQTGVGSGVVDRMRELGYRVTGVDFGSGAFDKLKYANKRAEMWGEMALWINSADIPDNESLKADLVGPTYSFTSNGQILIEKKEKMKSRGLASPDRADALALTFAQKIRNTSYDSLTARLR